MERSQLEQVLDAAKGLAHESVKEGNRGDTFTGKIRAQQSIAHSLVVIATLLDQIVGRDGLSVGTVRTESGI